MYRTNMNAMLIIDAKIVRQSHVPGGFKAGITCDVTDACTSGGVVSQENLLKKGSGKILSGGSGIVVCVRIMPCTSGRAVGSSAPGGAASNVGRLRASLPGVITASRYLRAFCHPVPETGILPELIGLFDLVSTIR